MHFCFPSLNKIEQQVKCSESRTRKFLVCCPKKTRILRRAVLLETVWLEKEMQNTFPFEPSWKRRRHSLSTAPTSSFSPSSLLPLSFSLFPPSFFSLSPTTTIQTIIQQSITYTENLVFLTHLSLPLFLFCTKFNWTKTGRENQSIRRRSLYQRSRWILYPRRGPHSLWNEHHEGSSLPKTVDSLCFPKETCCSSCSSNSSCDSFNCYWQRCNEKKDPGL